MLLVEDDRDDVLLLQELLLESHGGRFEITVVRTLAEARRLLGAAENEAMRKGDPSANPDESLPRAHRFDLILLDLTLPDRRGIATFRALAAEAARTPLLVLSGLDDERLALQTVEEGAQDYLVKGQVEPRSLARAIRHAIKRKEAEEQLFRYGAEMRRRNAELEDDLRMAREIQQAFLPQQFPAFPRGAAPAQSRLRFCSRYLPTTAVGGDFFHVLPLSDTRAGVFICDVMGHGVRAALVTAILRALVEELLPEAGNAGDPGLLMAQLNRALLSILRRARTPMFASAFSMIIDLGEPGGPPHATLRYANAGHPSPFLLRRAMGVDVPFASPEIRPLCAESERPGPALGVFPEAIYATHTAPVFPRDLLLLFTDGLFEVEDARGGLFTAERLRQLFRERAALPLARLVPESVEAVRQFAQGRQFADDVCLIGVEVGE